MNRVIFILLSVILLAGCVKITKETTETDVTPAVGSVNLFYFHGKQRCPTCNAIEALTKTVADSLSNEGVKLFIIDINEKENQPLVDRFEVSWSSLFVVGHDSIENLTETGFSHARNNPDCFKAQLTETIKRAE